MPAPSFFTPIRRALLITAIGAGLLAPAVASRVANAASVASSCESFLMPVPSNYGSVSTNDMRYVAYPSWDDKTLADANTFFDIVRLDRQTNTRVMISAGFDGSANGESSAPVITPDGRTVAFKSVASNLVSGDTNSAQDVFVRDVQTGTTERVSVDTNENQASSAGEPPHLARNPLAISDDGRFVAFTSTSPVLSGAASTMYLNLYVRDRVLGTTSRESVDAAGQPATDGSSGEPSLSADGRYIAFSTSSPSFGGQPVGSNAADVIVRDRETGANDLVSGAEEIQRGRHPVLSADGRTVALVGSKNLVGGAFNDANNTLIVSNRDTKVLEAASPLSDPWPNEGLALSPDGQHVAYVSSLHVPGTSHSANMVVEYDRVTKQSWVAGDRTYGGVSPISISTDGKHLGYTGGGRVLISPSRVPWISSLEMPGIGPAVLRQGMSHQTVYANGFNLSGSTIDLGPGITVHSVSGDWANLGQAVLDVSVAPSAAPGNRAPWVTRGECTSVGSTMFRVDPGVTMASVKTYAKASASTTIALVGTGFAAGATVTISGTGFTTSAVQVTDDTHASFVATSDANVAAGTRTITWTNASGTTGTCVDCLEIDNTSPSVAYVGPSDKAMSSIFVAMYDAVGLDMAGSAISVKRGGANVAFTKSVPEAGVFELKLANPSDGAYRVDVTPRDKAGNVGATVTAWVARGQNILALNAYGDFQGGAGTAAGDVDGDGIAEIITAAGPGGGPHVRVYKVNAVTGKATELAGFFAYDVNFTGGVRVAAVDINGDGKAEVVTAPGPGGGPHLRVFRINPTGGASEIDGFMAYAPEVTIGINITGGDINGDGIEEVITGPGPGGGPHVRAWNISSGNSREVMGFMAYDPGFLGGVHVAAADLDGDGISEIATGAGAGGGPHVQVFYVAAGTAEVVASFMAYDPGFRGGVGVAGGDLNGDGFDELLLSAGGGGGPHVRVLAFDEEGYFEVDGFMAYDPSFPGGVSVAAGDLDGDGDDDVITTPGPGMPVMIAARRVV